MASSGKKPEKFTILEQIYHEDKAEKLPKGKGSIKSYFTDAKTIDKLLPGAILFFGLAAIVLGFFQFRYNLTKYFTPSFGQDIDLQQDQTQEDLLGLRQKDTDQDGLSDYDELYLYGSSPYLQDTDSDGFSDQQEVIRGTDPNCPEGQNCFAIWSDSSWQNLGDQASDLLLSDEAKIRQLRLLLLQAGASVSDIDQLTDQEMLELYQELMSEIEPVAGVDQTTIDLQVQDIEDLTPEDIRDLLELSGVSSTLLDSISDEELMELVKEILAAQ